MGVEFLQSNLTAGELTPVLGSRTDVDKYNQGVAKATNMVIMPHGGMRRRAGLSKITDTNAGGEGRMVKFVFNSEQTYIVYFRPSSIDIYRDGVKTASNLYSPYTTLEIINELDAIQSGDAMIITHETVAPQILNRLGSDSSWDLRAIEFTNLPEVAFGESIAPKYTTTGASLTVNVCYGDVILVESVTAGQQGVQQGYYKRVFQGAPPVNYCSNIDINTTDYASSSWELIASIEVVWSNTRGWPSVCTFYQARLWFAGSTSLPNSIWGSRTNGFFDFALQEPDGTVSSDNAIFDTLDTDQINKITNIFAGRSLQVFTTSNEFYNKSTIITPLDSQWEIQTGYGAKRLRPILVDGATLFVDSSKRSIRSFLYNNDEKSYNSDNITLLSSHLIQDVLALDSITGTAADISDYVYVVNTDGTLAVMNTMRSEGIMGWTQWVTDGEFLDVVVLEKEVYFLVKRLDSYFIEKLQEGTYTDHNVASNSPSVETFNIIDGADNIIDGTDNIVDKAKAVTTLQTNYDSVFSATKFKVIADLSIQDDQAYSGTPDNNTITVDRYVNNLESGLNFLTNVTTMDLSTATQKGSTLHRRKRVVKVDISVIDSLGVYARDKFKADRQFPVVLDQAPLPFTGFREMYLLGYGRNVDIEISQKEPLPFILRSVGYEVEY